MGDYPVKDGTGAEIISGAGGHANLPTEFITRAGAVVLNTDLLTGNVNGWYDASDFAEMLIHLIGSAGISAGAVAFEQTNDLAAAAVAPYVQEIATTSAIITTTTNIAANASRMFQLPITSRYVRVRISTAFVGGTVALSALGRGVVTQPRTVQIAGVAAHDAAIQGNPVRVGARAVTANPAAVATADTVDFIATLVGAQITRPFSIPELDWAYTALAGGVINTTDIVLKTAAGGSLKNYITGMTLKNANAVAGEVVLKDGATVIWRGHLSANMVTAECISFQTPLKTSNNAALNFACITTGQQVYVNAQGYAAP